VNIICEIVTEIAPFASDIIQMKLSTHFHMDHVITDDLYDSKDIGNRCNDLMNRTNNASCYFEIWSPV
jgi:hypothetical protein